MIPRIANRGHSFKGAGAYYLHDKKADTAERVLWTHTLNLPTENAEEALLCMAWTDTHSPKAAVGRKQTAGNVYSYSLAWHPDENPDKDAMLAAAKATLAVLGLSEHQAVIVAHGDTDHKHVHVVTNLVHPETGRVADLSYSKRRLQEWALEYEKAGGQIRCKEREENAERRKDGEITKYQDEKTKDAVSITELYRQSDSGAAFVSALASEGYILAQGDKGRLVIVDMDGKAQNLVRQIDGAKKKDIEAKLAEVLATLPTATEAMEQQRETRERLNALTAETLQPVPEATPTQQIVSTHIAAVGTLPQSSDADAHRAEVAKHVTRHERAEAEALREVALPLGVMGETPMNPAEKQHLSGFAQHMERVKQHLHRLVDWVREKPREYLDSVRQKRRADAVGVTEGREIPSTTVTHAQKPETQPPEKEIER